MRILTAVTLPRRQLRRRWAADLRETGEVLPVDVAYHRNRIGLDDLRRRCRVTWCMRASARHHLEPSHDDEPRWDRTHGVASGKAPIWSAWVHYVSSEEPEAGAGCSTGLRCHRPVGTRAEELEDSRLS